MICDNLVNMELDHLKQIKEVFSPTVANLIRTNIHFQLIQNI